MLMSGWNNYFLGKTEEAKTLFQRVLMNNPKDKSALDGLGRLVGASAGYAELGAVPGAEASPALRGRAARGEGNSRARDYNVLRFPAATWQLSLHSSFSRQPAASAGWRAGDQEFSARDFLPAGRARG